VLRKRHEAIVSDSEPPCFKGIANHHHTSVTVNFTEDNDPELIVRRTFKKHELSTAKCRKYHPFRSWWEKSKLRFDLRGIYIKGPL
jgi:hypothetical protein